MSRKKNDRRIQRTQQIIREALVELMLEKSYEKITVQNIIDRANVGRATFYNHYQDKDDLLLRGVAELASQSPQTEPTQTHQGHDNPKTEPHTIAIAGMFTHARQNSRLHQVMSRRSRENFVLEQVTAVLHQRIESQLRQLTDTADKLPIPLPILTQFLTGGLLSTIHWWHEHDFPYTAEEMDAFFQQIAMPGIATILAQANGVTDDEEFANK